VSAVVVNYNVRDLLVECLASLACARRRGELDEIIVVDSSSADGSVAAVRELHPDVTILEVPNRGYGAAANAGMGCARGDAFLVLNSDTIVEPHAVAKLAAQLFAKPDIGMVGPRLQYPDGSLQPTRRRFPTRWTPLFESTIIEEWFPNNRWCRSYRMTGEPASGSQDVDWLVGAALMARRAAVKQSGGFDEAFRMYAEELEWCYRLGRHGWRVVYVPNAQVVHHEGASTSQSPARSRLEFDRGRLRAQRIVHGDASARLTSAALRLNYVALLAREALKWALGHRRELRAERIAAYWALMRSGLDGD
jgi:GT2 family glycosyltransferase